MKNKPPVPTEEEVKDWWYSNADYLCSDSVDSGSLDTVLKKLRKYISDCVENAVDARSKDTKTPLVKR